LCPQTNDFKNALNQAKEIAMALPGGELSIEEQDEIISMLENLRDQKRLHLELLTVLQMTLLTSSLIDSSYPSL
jgi:hypothetical protein